jgi:hypothetical protein
VEVDEFARELCKKLLQAAPLVPSPFFRFFCFMWNMTVKQEDVSGVSGWSWVNRVN